MASGVQVDLGLGPCLMTLDNLVYSSFFVFVLFSF